MLSLLGTGSMWRHLKLMGNCEEARKVKMQVGEVKRAANACKEAY